MATARTPVTDPAARLAVIRALTEAALAGQWIGDAPFDSLRIVVAETGIPHALVWDVVEGFALDAAGWRPASEDDLYRYCYHVAGAVGWMMAVVMGVSPDDDAVLDRACDLGIAFQLGNIVRDLGEDDAAGRCYIPLEWQSEPRSAIAARLAERAAAYADSGRAGDACAGLPIGVGGARGGGDLWRYRADDRRARRSGVGHARSHFGPCQGRVDRPRLWPGAGAQAAVPARRTRWIVDPAARLTAFGKNRLTPGGAKPAA